MLRVGHEKCRLTYDRRILAYLIPLRILRGHLPSEELFKRFPTLAEVYSPFVDAVRKADIKAYDEALLKWEKKLLDMNTYFIFERARELAMRGLFRKVYVVEFAYACTCTADMH